MGFSWSMISDADKALARHYIGVRGGPDYSFLPGPNPYQFRWYVSPYTYDPKLPAVFLHIMVADDPTDELHDHNWDNTSFMLAGRMIETYGIEGHVYGERVMKPGTVIQRKAHHTHSLRLDGCTYAMTLFAVGPKLMDNHYFKITERMGSIIE